MAHSQSWLAPVVLSFIFLSTSLIADDRHRTARYSDPEKSQAFKKRFPTTAYTNHPQTAVKQNLEVTPFDARRAAKSLADIRAVVDRMKKWPENTPPQSSSKRQASRQPSGESKATAQVPFDPKRAANSLAEISDVVDHMKASAAKANRQPAGVPARSTVVHQFQRRTRVPTPDRIDPRTGVTYRELAEQRLREKGYVKTASGWRSAQQIAGAQPAKSKPAASEPSQRADADLFR